MDWNTYYEKFYDWATSTQISRMSSLTSFGASSEVAEVAQEYMDEKAASRLIKKAIAYGVQFTPDEIYDLSGCCDTSAMNELLKSAKCSFTQEQLEDAAYFQIANEKFNERYQCPDKITIPENALGEMSSLTLADGKIKVSPIAICVDTTDMPDYPSEYIAVTKIRFKDGTEYLVRDDNTANYMFAVGNTDREVTFLFNRMIDVSEISSVILDGGLAFSAA